MRPEYDTYKVTCGKCGGSDVLKIDQSRTVYFTNHVPIIAARWRPTMDWGFECQCGQDSRLAPEEEGQIEMLVQGGTHAIEAIKQSLLVPDKNKFIMERM